MDRLLAELNPLERDMIQLRLEGHSTAEAARQFDPERGAHGDPEHDPGQSDRPQHGVLGGTELDGGRDPGVVEEDADDLHRPDPHCP